MSEVQRNRTMHAGDASLVTGLVAERRHVRTGVRVVLALSVMALAIGGFAAQWIPLHLLASLLLVTCAVSWILWRRSHVGPRIAVSGLSQAIEPGTSRTQVADETVFALLPLPAMLVDAVNGIILDANAAALKLYGCPVDAVRGSPFAILGADARDGGNPGSNGDLATHKRADGSTFPVELAIRPFEHGSRAIQMVVIRDLTSDRAQASALELSERRYAELIQLSLGMVFEHDLDGRLGKVNPAFACALGYPESELIGRNLGEFVVARQRDAFHRYLLEVSRNGSCSGLVHVVDSAGDERLWEFRHRLRSGADGNAQVICSAIDVSERSQGERRPRETARRDALTGCYNRRQLEYVQAEAGSSARWACVVVDIDSLKRTNDTYGHAAGDQAILRLARFLERIVHQRDVIVRLGGDEFAILMPEHDRQALEAYVSRLQAAQATQETTPFSFGFALRKDNEDLEHTIQRADHQMIERRLIERISIRLDSPGSPRQAEVHQPVLHLHPGPGADVIDIKRAADQS